MAMAPGYQRNPVADKNRGHADNELVDRLGVQKGSYYLTTAQQPDVLPGLRAQVTHEWADRVAHELHPRRSVRRRDVTGGDYGALMRVEFRVQAQGHRVLF